MWYKYLGQVNSTQKSRDGVTANEKVIRDHVGDNVVTFLIGTIITVNYATAGETARDGRFIAYDNGTVLDTKTHLMWAAKDNGD